MIDPQLPHAAPVAAAAAHRRVAVVGAGMAGSSCARALADAGFEVHVFDKSRGVGGRMATRRAWWSAGDGAEHLARFDHGAPGFNAQSAGFLHYLGQAAGEGRVARWQPCLAPGGRDGREGAALWVPVPDLPALCRALLDGVPVQTNHTVDALRVESDGWRLESAGVTVGHGFGAVVLAIPGPQAAPLLQPHHADWAQQARSRPMQPAWVLMGVTPVPEAPPWDLACPTAGPLALVVRNDAKPARESMPGLAHWVVHASAEWSRAHLEAPAAEVQAALQAALAGWIGQPLAWLHAAVHRWRYASVASCGISAATAAERCRWHAASGLGVCGDALRGAGVEGAWCSGRALAAAIIGHASQAPVPEHVRTAEGA